MKFKTIVKKVLSIVLTISLLLTLGVGNVSVNADQNQKITWLQYKHNKTIVETDDSRYGGYAIYNTSVAHQHLYTAIETTPEETYKIKFSIKANEINRIEIFAVTKGAEVPWGSSALTSTSDAIVDYKVYRGFSTSETEWTDISVEFETVSTENVQYYVNIMFKEGGTTNAATVSDFSLKKIEKINWLQYKYNKTIEETDDSRYGGYAVLNKTVASQNLYTPIDVEPGELYNATFSIKVNAIARIEIFAVAKGAEVPFGSSALDSKSSTLVDYKAYKNFTTSETEWTDISVKFETVSTENVQYYMNILFGAKGTSNTAIVSDFSVVKTNVNELVVLNFESNGGSAVDAVRGEAGKMVNMPANPTKEGYTFAGWYLDEDCTKNYTVKVFPENNTILYAKWINGAYQDFENFTVNSGNLYNSSLGNDFENSYSGSYFHKTTIANGAVSRVIIAQNTNEKLSAFAKAGDQITISFKYKLVSGSIEVYPHTSTKTSGFSPASYTNSANKTAYANGYVHYNTSFTEPSNDWQTFTHTYTLNSQEYFDSIGVNAEKALGYTLLYMTAKSDNTEFYVDDVIVYKTINIPINYSNEAVRLESVNPNKPLSAAILEEKLEFKALCDSSVTPIVKYGTNVLAAKNGIYTIIVTEDDTLTVTTEGTTEAQNHLPNLGLNGEDLTTYNEEVFSNKIWQGDTIYHEAVMFANSSDGIVQTTKKLLYPIDDIISVRNDNLNVWYVKGVDFDVVDGKLVWIEGGKCPIYTGVLSVPADENDPYYDETLDYGGFANASAYYTLGKDEDMGLYLMNDSKHEDYCVFVTYKHSKTWDELGEEGYTPVTPENQSYDMDKFYNKLKTSQDVNVLVYGDSVATGCASTGRNRTYELFSKTRDENGNFDVTERITAYSGKGAPTFFEQATSKLVKDYGNNNTINYYNIAHGGTTALWGAKNLADRIAGMNEYYCETIVPDIIYVKFAANDVGTSIDSYRESMTSITEQFEALYPNAIVVLISGKINNERSYIFADNHNNTLEHEKVLSEIADQNTNCVVAKTTSVWAEIVESKDYEDYLSNNINHANDFWAAITASIIVESIKKVDGSVALTTAYNNSAAMRSAENSSTGKNGVRIYNQIKSDWLESKNIVEYGSIAINTNLLSGAELTLANGRKGIAFSDGTFSAAKSALWEVKNGSVVFTAYLVNIPELAYDDNFAVRSYAIDSEGNVYYGDSIEFAIYEVANAIDNGNTADGSTSSEVDAKAFYAFVTDKKSVEYKNWCIDNNKSIGALFQEKYIK